MIIAAAIGVCANKTGCELAPDALNIEFDTICRFDKEKTSENLLAYFTNLAKIVEVGTAKLSRTLGIVLFKTSSKR